MEKKFISLAQHRATKLREEAKKHQPSIQALADRYDVSLSMATKILRGERCCGPDAEPIYLALPRKLRQAAEVALMRRLAFTYAQIAEYLNVSHTTAWNMGQLDASCDAELNIELLEQIQSCEDKRIQRGKYRLVGINRDEAMLIRDGEAPIFIQTKQLIGRIKLCPQKKDLHDIQ